MSIQDIFQELVLNKNEESLYNLIQEKKNSIPEKQKIGKGIVWSLRQVRKQIQEKMSLNLQRQSLKVLINSKYWQIRMMVALLASSCASKEGSVSDYISYIENTANDSHFAVRESAQMALRELLQDFPNDIILIYNEWVKDSNEFTRRCVSESLRPVLVNKTKSVCLLEISDKLFATLFLTYKLGSRLRFLRIFIDFFGFSRIQFFPLTSTGRNDSETHLLVNSFESLTHSL